MPACEKPPAWRVDVYLYGTIPPTNAEGIFWDQLPFFSTTPTPLCLSTTV